MPHLTVDFDDGLATLTLSNPPQNRIDDELIEDLSSALDKFAPNGTRAVLVTSEGPDFCFGGEISTWPEASQAELKTSIGRGLAVFNRFETVDVPVVVAIHGHCLGGGLELAVRGDIIFAADTARFGHPEQTIGIVTLLGGVYRVAERVGAARAMEWAMTSEFVTAATMREAGLINRVVPEPDLLKEATAFARRLAAGPTRAHGVHKALLREWRKGGIAAADAALIELGVPLFETDDASRALLAARSALQAGAPRPAMNFQGC
ncbi:enoyl-CoA hydratase/isomerase family protein [Paenarthrobacter sp. NPDC089322]|uniref:enoyl-CoA hydratase/isomerase family protein n=1 Tax=Paenarthrobacter sp. NPDC089322 TaxID=3155065 RepID=UPI00342FA41C